MTLCVIDGGHCLCQPDEGVYCVNAKTDADRRKVDAFYKRLGVAMTHCVWDDCDQEAIYCEGHAREYADGLRGFPGAAPPAVGGEPVAWWRTREAGETLGIFYGAHPPKWGARSEWQPLYAAPRESPIPIDGERWEEARNIVGGTRAELEKSADALREKAKQLAHFYNASSVSPERQTDETGNAGSDGALAKGAE